MPDNERDLRQIRLSRNQTLVRQVNERVEQVADGYSADGPISFVCECSNTDCMAQLELSREEYERIRGVSTWFAVAPEHEIPDIEVTVDSTDRYLVVQKIEAGGVFAAATDPRRET